MNQQRRPLKPEDLFHFKMSTHPRFSPDGQEIVCVEHRVDPRDNCYYSNLALVDAATGSSRPFTRGPQRDLQPLWTPDGSALVFVSNRLKTAQIFSIRRDGGEAECISALPPGSISGLTVSPDGRLLAFSFHADLPTIPAPGGYSPPPDMRIPSTAPRVRYLTRFPYKEEPGGYLAEGYPQLYVLEIATGEARPICPGPFRQVSPAFSPDGSTLAFYAVREQDPGFLTQGLDLWLVSLETGVPRRLMERWGPAIAPSWSPDGTRLATIAFRDFEHSAEFHNEHLLVVPVNGGPPVVASRSLDRYAYFYVATDVKAPGTGSSSPSWSPDGRTLRFIAMDRGTVQLFEAEADGSAVRPVTRGPHCVADYARQGDQMLLLMMTPDCIQDIWMLEPDGTGHERMRRLTASNAPFLSGVDLGRLEEYTFRSFDGTEIQGWLTLPPGFDPTQKYPLILQVHGGPHIQAGYAFFQECYVLAAEGYVVAHFNPRGSHGYGEEFAGVIFEAWGTVDYQDLMCAVDRLCEEPYVDRERLGVTGGSYGGYMTNWIVTQTSRFRAAVSHRSTSNLTSVAFNSDMGFENARNAYRYQPWENWKRLMEMSPISFVDRVTTPILFTQSDNDQRCSIEQAEQMYSALKYLGKTAAFCRFPEESHELSRWGRPDRRMERLYRTLDWFRQHL